MAQSPVEAYRETSARCANRGELLLSLYDGAIRYAETARLAILRQDPSAKGRALDALLAILMELTRTLNRAQSPELCDRLLSLYTYFTNRVQQAGLRMDVKPLEEVIRHLKGLRESFAVAVAQAKLEGVI